MGIFWIWVLLSHCIRFQVILITTASYPHEYVYLLGILLVGFVSVWMEMRREDKLWSKGKAAEACYIHHWCRKVCWFCIPAKMAGLQEQTLPSSSALPQVRLTMELMGHGQWERGNVNSCFMCCTMLSPASAGFSGDKQRQQIFPWQMFGPAILWALSEQLVAKRSSGPALGRLIWYMQRSLVKQGARCSKNHLTVCQAAQRVPS